MVHHQLCIIIYFIIIIIIIIIEVGCHKNEDNSCYFILYWKDVIRNFVAKQDNYLFT